MLEDKNVAHIETVERYCHVIGKNTPVCRSISNGKVCYECVNKHICEQNGGCKNERFSSESSRATLP